MGVVAWLAPFVVAFLAFPFRESARPLFDSIMAVTVTATAVLLGLVYLRQLQSGFVREGLLIGLIWFVVRVLIDAPLMLFSGPMKMPLGVYMADIGLTYVSIPVVTLGLAAARARGGGPMKLRLSWRATLADSKDLPRVEPIKLTRPASMVECHL